ncbi:Snf7 family protein [Candidatus Bathyarchaeota archaeon]|nr:Snf7 family protein [Candidatus Bathyarchaeota archaeon]
MSGIIDRIKNFVSPPKPDLNQFMIELKMYNGEIKRIQKQNEKRAVQFRERAKNELKKGETARVKEYMRQHMRAKTTAYSLDMFTIKMEGLIFDLQSGTTAGQMAESMGNISTTLDKLKGLNVASVAEIMTKLNRQMMGMGVAMDTMYQQLDTDPFEVESYTDADVSKEIELLTTEVMAQSSADLPSVTVDDLVEERKKLDEK